jgi:HPt (histidine-containing phosphotransfer) domain-containing protein
MQVPVELKRKYIDRRINDIQSLLKSLEDNDYAPAAKLGHQVKGNAGTFELPQMTEIGVAIELAALQSDRTALEVLAQRMTLELLQARQLFH